MIISHDVSGYYAFEKINGRPFIAHDFTRRMAANSCAEMVEEYEGKLDCKAGLIPQKDSQAYLLGYSQQYEIEQIEGSNHE